jgi:hypothetical protein
MALLGVGGAAAAFAVFGGLGGLGKAGPSDPFDAIPRASFIAATVDVAELRRSPVFEAVFASGGDAPGADPMRRALGVGALADACGFDPLTRVQRFAVAIPEEGERGEFGVAARVEVTRDELERCARSLADKRGGRAETRDVGSFVVLEDDKSASRARLAYGRGGLLVVGKGTWFDAMLGAADRVQPGLRDAQEHVALRASLTSREGFARPTLLATAILPRSLRERLKGEMGAEIGAQDGSSAAMAGVLGVSAVGVAVVAGGPGQNVGASVELACDGTHACEAVEKLVQTKRREWSSDLTWRMLGLGPLLDSVEIKREGARLHAKATTGSEALAAGVDRVMKLFAFRSLAGGGGDPSRVAPTRPPEKRPDESLPARDAGTR